MIVLLFGRLDFVPGGRVPEVGNTIPAQSRQRIPIGRKTRPHRPVPDGVQADQLSLPDIIPNLEGRLQLSSGRSSGYQPFAVGENATEMTLFA